MFSVLWQALFRFRGCHLPTALMLPFLLPWTPLSVNAQTSAGSLALVGYAHGPGVDKFFLSTSLVSSGHGRVFPEPRVSCLG